MKRAIFLAIFLVTISAALAQIPEYKSWLVGPGGLYTLEPAVGIGTAAPAAKLDIVGDIMWSGSLLGGTVPWARLWGFPPACPSGQFVTGLGSALTCEAPASGIGGSGTPGSLAKFTAVDAIGDSIVTEVGGNVGIGTASPAAKLDVAGGVRLSSEGTKPACTNALRGTLWFTKTQAYNTTDTLEVCQSMGLGTVNVMGAHLPSARENMACA